MTTTPNFGMELIAFDTRPWDAKLNANLSIIDSVLAQYLGASQYKGVWANNTVYVLHDTVTDVTDGKIYQCLVGNTSAGTGTFAQERVNHPTYWSQSGASYGGSFSGDVTVGTGKVLNSSTGTTVLGATTVGSGLVLNTSAGVLTVADAAARTSALAARQAQDSSVIWGGASSGAANTYTFSVTPAITVYATGQHIRFKAHQTNSGASTININSVGSVALTKIGAAALTGGEITNGGVVDVVYDGTQFQVVGYPSSVDTGQTVVLTASTINGGAGFIVDRAYAEYTTNADITAQIPQDDTIPQNTEGTQILSVSITPKSATNRVRATFFGWGSSAALTGASAALFRNSNANAIDAMGITFAAAYYSLPFMLIFEDSPGSTSPQTYAVRVGPAGAVTMRMNGVHTNRVFGGSSRCVLVLEEIHA